MKNKTPKIISRTFVSLAVAVIATFAATHNAGAQLYADPSSTGEWNSTRWSADTNGPFTDPWTANADSIFLSGNDYTFGATTAGNFNVGNITVQSNATVKLTAYVSGALGTGGNVRTITVETNAVLDFDLQSVQTSVGFIKEGSGVFALAARALYGDFTLNGGTVVALQATALGTTGVLTLHNGIIAANNNRVITNHAGGVFITGDIQIGALSNNYAANAQYLINDNASISFLDESVSLDGGMRTLTIGGNGAYSFSGVLDNGGLTVDLASGATGRLILFGNNTYTGGTVINGGATLQLGTNTASGSVVGNITNNGVVSIYRSDNTSMSNLVSGSGSLVKLGANTLALLADNTYTGVTTISNGVLSLGDGGTSGSVAGDIVGRANTTLVINRSDNMTFGGVISNTSSSSLVKLGGGTATLTASNGNFAGTILISEGALQLGDGSAGSGRIGTNDITNNSLLILNRGSGANNMSNLISGTGSVVQESSTILVLFADNTYTGDTVITGNNGTLVLGSGGTTGSVAGKINITNATATLRITRSDTLILGNEISGDGRVIQNGTGTTILTANNSYGNTIISNGILQIGNGGTSGTAGTGGINISNAASQLVLNRSDALILSNVLSGAGQLGQSGSGITTLANSNTFTGATTVTAGTLELAAGSGAALGATASVTVSSGATLLLSTSDQVNNAATVTLSGGTIERASGVSEIFGDLNLTAASFLDYGTGDAGTLTFGTYTPSSLLAVGNFFEGNKLVFSSNLTGQIDGNFTFDNDFMTDWNGSTFTITAIPEPHVNVLLVMAGLGLADFFLRRRMSGRAGQGKSA